MAETKIYIPDALDTQLREAAMKRFGYGRGSISRAVETAITQWLAREYAINKVINVVVEKAKKDKNVIAVLLFGSYLRMESGFEDVDVALLARDQEKIDVFSYRNAIEDTGALNKINIDVVILNNMPVTAQGEILDEASVLYVRDENGLRVYCLKIVEEYNSAARIRALMAS